MDTNPLVLDPRYKLSYLNVAWGPERVAKGMDTMRKIVSEHFCHFLSSNIISLNQYLTYYAKYNEESKVPTTQKII